MQEDQIRESLTIHWRASAAGDANAEHDIYDDDAICDYPQSGERIFGRSNLQALRSHHPGKPSGFEVKRILGKGDLWITEYTIIYQERTAYTVSIMEFRNGKVVHETQYFADPFEAPAWRRQWVQQTARPDLKALAEERGCPIRDTDNLVGRLPIEFEIQFSPGPAIIPVGEMLELAASH